MSLLQIQIYTRKFFRTLKKDSIISIILSVVITALMMCAIKDQLYGGFANTKVGLFALVCVCIWVGIFNSIQLVCKEKNDIVKDELDKSLMPTSYMASHFIYQFFLCLVQSVIIFSIFYLFVKDHENFSGAIFDYFMTIFLITYASDAMAFVISSIVPNPNTAMTVMPLLLLVQLIMADVLLPLDDGIKSVSALTISGWGTKAFGIIGNICHIPPEVDKMAIAAKAPFAYSEGYSYGVKEEDANLYEGSSLDIIECWLVLCLFIAVFYFISVLALKITTRRIKK